jgi:hypothetical protein
MSHEVPICLLEKSKEFNDYDYALFHLINNHPSYKEFYKNSEREVVLDNSAYEFFIKKEKLEAGAFAECVEEINPSYFIIPDKLNDYKATLHYFEEWNNKYSHLKNKKIGVVQGRNLKEFTDCYNIMGREVDKIAISFGYSFLPSLVSDILRSSLNKYQVYALGRLNLLNFLISNNIIDKGKPHHLLGSYLPFEFLFYKNSLYDFIESGDTAYPIKNGFFLNKIKMDFFDKKKEILIDDFIDKKLDKNQEECIMYNVNQMKRFLEGKR